MNQRVREFIEKNIPALASVVIARTRPCVYALPEKHDDDKIAIGASKFGGCPDVPADFVWPMTADGPCWFVAQINLRDLNRFETGFRLPPNGLLSFFYHDRRGSAGSESKVYLFEELNLQRISVVRDPRYKADMHKRDFFSRALEFHQGYCLPEDINELGLPPSDPRRSEDYDDFREAFYEEFLGGIHQFFGRPRYHDAPAGQQLLASFGEVEDRYLYNVPDPANGTLDLSKVIVVYECT
jgi:uncharacterized protein YwqG